MFQEFVERTRVEQLHVGRFQRLQVVTSVRLSSQCTAPRLALFATRPQCHGLVVLRTGRFEPLSHMLESHAQGLARPLRHVLMHMIRKNISIEPRRLICGYICCSSTHETQCSSPFRARGQFSAAGVAATTAIVIAMAITAVAVRNREGID
ncbi:hypothetical protein BCR37DRAFT_53674 [Protomyces lactucae-debilis]|uniref:Uncharacterized protein n=1 Tax=Protomyces lactucae-debilis TaxID=2754530 RepID=A0A1Y2FA78_PROLT|nr:uncharacterized protein BCR37DRAFT_53674 [Protomyces lactucae-debilis]ORY80801.1 hypothetical protein BCR37DRAFT_53674 [Protomyces lactucae-debilis]